MATAVSETTALLGEAGTENVVRAVRRGSSNQSLGRGLFPTYQADEDGDTDAVKAIEIETTWGKEIRLLLRYASPLILTYLLQFSYSVVLVFVSGRLGTIELAASSLASSTANVTGIAIYEGLATCLDTLTSQAYGSGRKKLVGLHVQRMVYLNCIATIPVATVWFCSPWILAKLVPDPAVAEMSGLFLRFYIIGAPAYGIFEGLKRFTQAQGNFTASLVSLIICAPFNIFWNWLLVFHLDMGFQGAALAMVVSYWLQPTVLLLYINFVIPQTLECWPGFSLREGFLNWGSMLRLGIPGVVMVLAEWIAFEVLAFAASYIGNEYLAAQSVLMTISVTMYHIPFPVAVAASTRFGNLIGYGAVRAASTAWTVSYCTSLVIGVVDIVLLVSLRDVIAGLFTADDTVRAAISAVMPLIAALQLVDSTTSMANGLLRGLGRQKIGGWLNIVAYYVFGLPIALLLTFGPPHLKLFGLWAGPAVGLLIASITIFAYMWFTDWEKAVEEARARDESC